LRSEACNPRHKIRNVQDAGALAVIFAIKYDSNATYGVFGCWSDGKSSSDIRIPSVETPKAVVDMLDELLDEGPVTVRVNDKGTILSFFVSFVLNFFFLVFLGENVFMTARPGFIVFTIVFVPATFIGFCISLYKLILYIRHQGFEVTVTKVVLVMACATQLGMIELSFLFLKIIFLFFVPNNPIFRSNVLRNESVLDLRHFPLWLYLRPVYASSYFHCPECAHHLFLLVCFC
jgi:hypothetical protein